MMYVTNGDFSKAIDAAKALFDKPKVIREGKKHLDELHLVKTCLDYWQHFHSKVNYTVVQLNDKPMVELDFAIKIYEDEHLIIELAGTTDALVKITNGCFAVCDSKTHSLWSLNNKVKPGSTYYQKEIKDYFAQYELSLQLRFYAYIWKLIAKMEPEGSELKRILSAPIGAFIEGIFISKTEDTKFELSDVWQFSDVDMEEFDTLVKEKVYELANLFNSNRVTPWTMRDGIICGACVDDKFPCKFWNLCAAKSDLARTYIIQNDYKVVPYNPLNFSKGE